MRYLKFILALVVLAGLACGFLWRKPLKADFLTLNGGFNRWILAKHFCNRVYRIEDDTGYIPVAGEFKQVVADQLIKADGHMKRFGKKFLYVQGPDKVSVDRQNISKIFSKDDIYDVADMLLRVLKDAEVDAVDIREAVCPDAEAVRRNFMRTDTHWNYNGVLSALQYLTPIVCARLGKEDCGYQARLESSSWLRKDFPREVLGNLGRRTGPWFLPQEPFHYFVPAFTNSYTLRGKRPWEKVEQKHKGSFEKVFLCDKWLKKPASVYMDSAYDIIGGGNWTWFEIHNGNAPCKAKVLFVTDSYGRALVYFMSTVISHIRVIDYRAYWRRTIKNEVKAWHPNLVVVFASGRVLQNAMFWNFYCEKPFVRSFLQHPPHLQQPPQAK